MTRSACESELRVTSVIRPDDLVQKGLAPENAVKENLAVVHLTVVHVKIEAPVRCQDAVGLNSGDQSPVPTDGHARRQPLVVRSRTR